MLSTQQVGMKPRQAMWCCLSTPHPGLPEPELHRAVEAAHHQLEQPSSARCVWMSWGCEPAFSVLRNNHQAWSDRHGLEWDDRETYPVWERPRWHVEDHQAQLSVHLGADLGYQDGFRGGQKLGWDGSRNRDGDPRFLGSTRSFPPGVERLPSGSSSPIEPRAFGTSSSCATPPSHLLEEDRGHVGGLRCLRARCGLRQDRNGVDALCTGHR
ncbi:hypothetical protein QBC39DRAFT_336547 [Podospora conica]|nr:hypothetical protein QBC39DRAFT_336547 [Schizothecium conicum]